MNILIIIGHPKIGSFNHAIANVCKNNIIKNGHNVFFHDLYEEKFNPVLSFSPTTNEDSVEQYCRELATCDGIIIIHPNWWGQTPAIIKGWLDRVFIPDVAYTYAPDEKGIVRPKGLLKIQNALVINTSNSIEEQNELHSIEPLETIWHKKVFQTCGVSNFKRVNYSPISISTSEQRELWLNEVQILADTYFPKI